MLHATPVRQVDRADGMVYKQTWTQNASPTLTLHNHYLMIFSVKDVVDHTPDDQREFFRKFLPGERLALQGIPPEVAEILGPKLSTKAAGNAYPVPLIIAALYPILLAIMKSTLDLSTWPLPAAMLPLPDVAPYYNMFMRDVKKQPRLVKIPLKSKNSKKRKVLVSLQLS